jgi:fatty-acyl-CoA synthase
MTTRSPAVEPATLAELLTMRAEADPERIAYAEGDRELTYRQVFEVASSFAAELLAAGHCVSATRTEDGVTPRVALSLRAGLSFVRAFWGLQLLGVASCALNPQSPAESIVRRAQRVRPELLITDDPDVLAASELAGLRATLLTDVQLPAGPVPPVARATPDDIAVLQTTSGTSGEPRAAMIRHRNLLDAVRGPADALGFGAHDVFVSWVPPWHDLGLVRFIVGALYYGAPCHIVQPAVATIPEWLRTITRVRGTVTGAPDFAYRLAARMVDPKTVDLTSLRNATNGGEPVRASTIASFETTFGVAGVIRAGYGLAEATLGVTCMRPGEAVRIDERNHVSCGTALPRIELRIDAADTEAGEIVVGGPLVFAGYFDAPEATDAAIRDGWLYTGDIGRLDADGHLYVLGRKRAMLKRGGAVLAPREVEEAAQSVDGVRIAAAVGMSSEFATEEIVVAVEIDDLAEPAAIRAAVTDAVRAQLGFAPERVVALRRNSIPRTYNGKLRHDALRTALQDGTMAAMRQ